MFMQPMPAGGGNGGGVSRPFFVGLVLLLLFLSMQTDWSPQGAARGPLHGKLGAPSAAEVREGAKDKLIYDLSLSNERLEGENARLRQHMLDLRRAARAAGCDLNATEALSAAAFPELAAALRGGAARAAPAAPAGGPEGGAPGAARDPEPASAAAGAARGQAGAAGGAGAGAGVGRGGAAAGGALGGAGGEAGGGAGGGAGELAANVSARGTAAAGAAAAGLEHGGRVDHRSEHRHAGHRHTLPSLVAARDAGEPRRRRAHRRRLGSGAAGEAAGAVLGPAPAGKGLPSGEGAHSSAGPGEEGMTSRAAGLAAGASR